MTRYCYSNKPVLRQPIESALTSPIGVDDRLPRSPAQFWRRSPVSLCISFLAEVELVLLETSQRGRTGTLDNKNPCPAVAVDPGCVATLPLQLGQVGPGGSSLFVNPN